VQKMSDDEIMTALSMLNCISILDCVFHNVMIYALDAVIRKEKERLLFICNHQMTNARQYYQSVDEEGK